MFSQTVTSFAGLLAPVSDLLSATVRVDLWVGLVVIAFALFAAICYELRRNRRSEREGAAKLKQSHQEIVEALAVTINAKDEVTHEHVLRVQIYAAGVARLLCCSPAEIEALKAGALLHDIGKIAVPDYILNKPGKLTAAEFEKMKIHTVVGAQILSRVQFSFPVVPIVRHHHERWDGCGYPDGLKGETIPLTARILSVVDCFDAVRENRPYRRGLSRDEAIDYILRGSGSLYDPQVVTTFIANLPAFEAEISAPKEQDVSPANLGLRPIEQLTPAALAVKPAAGLAEENGQVVAVKPAPTSLAGADAPSDYIERKYAQALYRMGDALKGVPHNRQEMLKIFSERLREIVPYDACAITLVQHGTGERIVVYAEGQNSWLLVGRKIEMGEGVTGWVLANQLPFCNTDPRLDFPPALADRFDNLRTLAVFPITSLEGRHGAVSLYSAVLDRYTEMQQRLLQEAATIFAGALAQTPLYSAQFKSPLVSLHPPERSPRDYENKEMDSPIPFDYQSGSVS